jgi:hypothetical protein
MSGITLGVIVYSALQKRCFLPDSLSLHKKSFRRVEETISKVFNQNTHTKNKYVE